jgi:predicted transcriptional regulator
MSLEKIMTNVNTDLNAKIAELVSARAETTEMSAADIAIFTLRLHEIMGPGTATATAAVAPTKQQPAVPVEESVKADYIICLENGKKFTMLKRHLMQAYNMTPEQYRLKWDLPEDYPMTAPNYSKKKAHAAKQVGLGRYERAAAPEMV